ncbi:MAG: ABC transporter substrate-binding protein, partial [Oricola sp.]
MKSGLRMAARAATVAVFVAALGAATARAADEPQRVLSIGGAVTEIVYALGEEARLVGRDSTSTWPEVALALPDVGYMRALAPEGVLSMKPDLILAREGSGPPEAIEVLGSASVSFVEVPETFDAQGIDEAIEVVSRALGAERKGE